MAGPYISAGPTEFTWLSFVAVLLVVGCIVAVYWKVWSDRKVGPSEKERDA